MSTLYLVYKQKADGSREPWMIMPFDDKDFLRASDIVEAVLRDDAPEDCLKDGEAWVFVPQDEADPADLRIVLPEDSKNMPSPLVDNLLDEEETRSLLNPFPDDGSPLPI